MLDVMIENEPLARHSSWRIGGPARYYLETTSVDGLHDGIRWAQEHAVPLFLLGGGTNLLVRDQGFPGLVLRYRAQRWSLEHSEQQGAAGLLYVEAGAPMAGTVRRICAQGWRGLEWAEGLPGTIGGAVYGNAGCYGGDIASILQRAWLLVDGEIQVWPVERMGYAYRRSVLKDHDRRPTDAATPSAHATPIILAAEMRVVRADPAELAETMRRIAAERKLKTPWGSSCGSVFKNPTHPVSGGAAHRSAGQLIDQAGLKGTRIGAAEISQRHGNYIVNLGGASSEDVVRLIDLARTTVLRQFGVELDLEVQIL